MIEPWCFIDLKKIGFLIARKDIVEVQILFHYRTKKLDLLLFLSCN